MKQRLQMAAFDVSLWLGVKYLELIGRERVRPEVLELYRSMVLTDEVKLNPSKDGQIIDFRTAKLHYYQIGGSESCPFVKRGDSADSCCQQLFNDAEVCLISAGVERLQREHKAKELSEQKGRRDKNFERVFRK